MQTFEGTETAAKDLQEPDAQPEEQEEQRGKSKSVICIFVCIVRGADKYKLVVKLQHIK